MTTYNTAALAEALDIGSGKAATRELRKFLRTDFRARQEATPGKGGRYSIDLNKRELTAMAKRYKAWATEQEAEKEARKKALEAVKKPSVNAIADDANKGGDTVNSIAEAEDDDPDEELEGPSDEEIAAMLSDDDD